MYRENALISGRRLEPLIPLRKPVPIRAVLGAIGQMDHPAVEPLQGFEHRPVVLHQQAVGDVQFEVGVDADQMGIECGMVNFRERVT